MDGSKNRTTLSDENNRHSFCDIFISVSPTPHIIYIQLTVMMWLDSLKNVSCWMSTGQEKQIKENDGAIHPQRFPGKALLVFLSPARCPPVDFSSKVASLSRLYSWNDRLWSLQAMASHCGGLSEILTVVITSAQLIFFFFFFFLCIFFNQLSKP